MENGFVGALFGVDGPGVSDWHQGGCEEWFAHQHGLDLAGELAIQCLELATASSAPVLFIDGAPDEFVGQEGLALGEGIESLEE